MKLRCQQCRHWIDLPPRFLIDGKATCGACKTEARIWAEYLDNPRYVAKRINEFNSTRPHKSNTTIPRDRRLD